MHLHVIFKYVASYNSCMLLAHGFVAIKLQAYNMYQANLQCLYYHYNVGNLYAY